MNDNPQPPAIDISVPHSARIWNYWLGGKDNYQVDREAGDQYRLTFPGVVDTARASRAFLVRTVRFLAGEAGMRQFLDIGTGLPTADNTHEVAQRSAPECKIVYVDNDPLVLAHARALLTGTPEGKCHYIDADIRDPDTILAAAAETLDLARPVGLILSGILGHITDYDQARSLVAHLMGALPPASHLSLNDGTSIAGGPATEQAQQDYDDTGAVPYKLRTLEQITGFFEGLELLEPGVVSVSRWRYEAGTIGGEPPEVDAVGGVATKP